MPPRLARTVEPDPALIPAFDEAHARYRAARDAIGGLA
jgi:xylulokinase